MSAMSNPTQPRSVHQRAAQGHIVQAASQWHRDSLLPDRARAVPGMPSEAIECAQSLVSLREIALLGAVGQYLKQL